MAAGHTAPWVLVTVLAMTAINYVRFTFGTRYMKASTAAPRPPEGKAYATEIDCHGHNHDDGD